MKSGGYKWIFLSCCRREWNIKKIFLSLIKQQAPIVVWKFSRRKVWRMIKHGLGEITNVIYFRVTYTRQTLYFLDFSLFLSRSKLHSLTYRYHGTLENKHILTLGLALAVGILIMFLTLFNNSRSDDVQYIVEM